MRITGFSFTPVRHHRPATSESSLGNAPGAVDVPTDKVETTALPPLKTRLGSMGFLETFSALPTPFNSVLDATTRRELEASLQRLEDMGVTFETEKKLKLPFTDDNRPLKAAEVLDSIEAQNLDPKQRPSLYAAVPWENGAYIRDFGQLLAIEELLDGGGGQLLEAARSLEKVGLVHNPERLVQDIRAGSAGYIMLEKPRQFDHPEPDRVDSEDGLFFIDYLEGSGQDRGLKQPEIAQGLKRLVQENWMARDRAYRVYAEGSEYARLSRRDGPTLQVAREHLSQPEQVMETWKSFQQAYRDHLSPALAKAGRRIRGIPDSVVQTDQKFPVTTRVQAYAGVVQAAAGLDLPEHKLTSAVHQVYTSLVEHATTEAQLFTRLRAVAPTLASEGQDPALKLLDELNHQDAPIRLGPREAVFEEIRQRTGSLSLAQAGINLVRIPLAGESQEERLELYSEIAARLPEENRDLTPEFYQEALIGRDQEMSLKENGRRFVTILGACANLKQPGLAPAVYHILHNKGREGADLEQGLEDFVKAAVTGKSVAEALTHVAKTLEPGSIEFLEDGIQVGDFNLDIQ